MYVVSGRHFSVVLWRILSRAWDFIIGGKSPIRDLPVSANLRCTCIEYLVPREGLSWP